MNANIRSNIFGTSVLLAATLAAGCRDTGPRNEQFFVEDDSRSVTRTLDRQIANGARYDAMLRDLHFDGRRLNSLGRAKVDRMMTTPGPVTVYLPGQADAATVEGRRESILAYAKDIGRDAADLTITQGINPATAHAAAPLITRMPKTELGQAEQASTPGDTSGAAGDLGLSGNNSPTLPGSTSAKTGG